MNRSGGGGGGGVVLDVCNDVNIENDVSRSVGVVRYVMMLTLKMT